ncbi:uncharacterized protein cubi_02323 [Cryptosporidium ubiquitum]|uniref:Uncharacterized protein n=1 Tax=Cryptosporidium ubiquitum TaxID=857276 RepID=A0A1J4MJ92_9CRYT|nr:uncharacterized protein cubi_02323 [Cryptosporidium ubiquitum]OII73092.1 hypothetical protein cubi_02323 [Cryptosporidium ubiquitum]
MKHIRNLLLIFALINSVCYSKKAPKLEDEIYIDSLDKNLSESEKEKKMEICFELTQKELIEKREFYQKIAASIKDQESITPDDAIRALFHQNLVTCYFNFDMQDMNSVINGKASKESIMKIFSANKNTPLKFSSYQLKILERVISQKTKNTSEKTSRKIVKQLSGFYGYLYFVFALLVIVLSFYFALNRLNKSIKGATKKKIKNN